MLHTVLTILSISLIYGCLSADEKQYWWKPNGNTQQETSLTNSPTDETKKSVLSRLISEEKDIPVKKSAHQEDSSEYWFTRKGQDESVRNKPQYSLVKGWFHLSFKGRSNSFVSKKERFPNTRSRTTSIKLAPFVVQKTSNLSHRATSLPKAEQPPSRNPRRVKEPFKPVVFSNFKSVQPR